MLWWTLTIENQFSSKYHRSAFDPYISSYSSFLKGIRQWFTEHLVGCYPGSYDVTWKVYSSLRSDLVFLIVHSGNF